MDVFIAYLQGLDTGCWMLDAGYAVDPKMLRGDRPPFRSGSGDPDQAKLDLLIRLATSVLNLSYSATRASAWVHFRIGATFLKLHRRARGVRRVTRNLSAFSANSAVKSNAYLAFAPKLKCTLLLARNRKRLTIVDIETGAGGRAQEPCAGPSL